MKFAEIFQNQLLMCPLVSWAVAQILKTIVYFIENKKIDFTRLFGDGGMPSAHSATVASLATSSALTYGFASEIFAVSAIVAVVVMHDAMGIRMESGKQARLLNELVEFLKFDSNLTNAEKLKELLGHTPIQVIFGALVGIIVSLIMGA